MQGRKVLLLSVKSSEGRWSTKVHRGESIFFKEGGVVLSSGGEGVLFQLFQSPKVGESAQSFLKSANTVLVQKEKVLRRVEKKKGESYIKERGKIDGNLRTLSKNGG